MIEKINTILKFYKKIFIIEDSAQSHFAFSCFNCKNNTKKVCCKKERNDHYADISCYSFYPAKNIGAFGDYPHPEVKKADIFTINTCIQMGIRPRIEINAWEDAKPYMDMGVIDFSIGNDLVTVYNYCQEQGEKLAKLLR